MAVKPFRIPKQVILPGLVVQVHLVGPKDKVLDGRAGAWSYLDGVGAVILIDKTLPATVQRYTLLHELQHTLIDLLDLALEEQSVHFKTQAVHALTRRKG